MIRAAFAKANGDGLSVLPKSAPHKQPTSIVLCPQQSAAQYATIQCTETLPDTNVMKAARYQALQRRGITALQAELTAIMKEMHSII